ncbi:hypothetical protein KRMM14A1259_58600 [Krasilnikovia sp. MM14-A1259]
MDRPRHLIDLAGWVDVPRNRTISDPPRFIYDIRPVRACRRPPGVALPSPAEPAATRHWARHPALGPPPGTGSRRTQAAPLPRARNATGGAATVASAPTVCPSRGNKRWAAALRTLLRQTLRYFAKPCAATPNLRR